jgi:hypothetical protein
LCGQVTARLDSIYPILLGVWHLIQPQMAVVTPILTCLLVIAILSVDHPSFF